MHTDTLSFNYKRIAEGYAKDRPFLHKHVMDLLKARLSLKQNFKNGLDVGCGAGLSSKALRLVCDHVTGTDISAEMVQAAAALYTDESFTFLQCKAEELDETLGSFDIVTAAGVINWVDETIFLPALEKMMEPNGILLIYDFGITDEMEGNANFTDWYREQYLAMFPKPPRKENVWTEADVSPYHFHIMAQDNYKTGFPMDKEQFIRFMLLQSNVIAQVEEKGKTLTDVKKWFENTLTPYFEDNKKENLIFAGYNWYLQKQSITKGAFSWTDKT